MLTLPRQHLGFCWLSRVGITVTSVMLVLFLLSSYKLQMLKMKGTGMPDLIQRMELHGRCAVDVIGLYSHLTPYFQKTDRFGIFQTSLFLLYISLGWVEGGAPIIMKTGN